MTDKQHYDAVVIGTGQAGMPLCTALVKAGRKTAIIERAFVGGTCINYGCTPTKTMVASARVAYSARHAAEYGVDVGEVSVDMRRVRQRKRDMVVSFRDGDEKGITDGGVDLIFGEASFTGPKSLQVRMNDGSDTRQIEADLIFIDTGTRPAVPDLDGLADVHFLDSTSIMELDEVPDRLLILGGGYIGLEFAQMFRRFGSQVTVIARGDHLLSKEDPDVADGLAEILKQDGVEILYKTSTLKVRQASSGKIEMTLKGPDGEYTRTGSHLLVATGRTPNSDSLNLAAAGIQADERGFIKVNGKLETNVPGVYALGEANGEPAFTHIAYDDYRIICANLINGHDVTTEGRILPYVVFTDPQLGRVGMSEEAARKSGRRIKIARIPMNYVARAIETGEDRGFMKAIVDQETEEILGCAILGLEGGEIMAQLQIAMMGKVRYPDLRDGIFAHPTLAEGLNTLFSNFE